jgi:hypothetical protein
MTLRAPIFADPTITPVQEEAFTASGMNPIRRAYNASRIGTDINSLAAQEATQRAMGDTAAADANRAQITALQQRQSAYAPDVGRVENIKGVGDAFSWLGTQIGQGAGSMQDPVALATGLTAAGNLAGAIPHPIARGVGTALKLAAPVGAFGINQRQMTGDFYNRVQGDPEVTAKYSPQELALTANAYGAGAGAIDTVLPTVVGRQLGGSFLRKGLSNTGMGTKMGVGLLGEGTTELAQDGGALALHSYMNPNRDTSGDAMDLVNSFAGGMAGASPFVTAGAAAEHVSRRVGHTAGVVSEKTGEVVDLLSEKAEPYVEKGKGKLEKVIDLFRNDDGDVTPKSVKDKVMGTAQDMKAKLDEHELMKGMPPADILNDDAAYAAWFDETTPKRRDAVLNRLADLADEGDEKATDLYTRFGQVQTQGEQDQIINEGAEHVLSQNEWTELEKQAQAHAKQAGRLVNRFGSMLGKGARAAGSAAMDLGKAAVSGFKGDKKNMQIDPFEQVLADQALEGGKEHVAGLKQQAEREKSYQRAKVMSEFLAAEAKSAMEGRGYGQNVEGAINVSPSMANRTGGTRMPAKSSEAMTNFMKDIGLEIADIAENWITPRPAKAKTGNAPTGPTSTLKQPADSRGQQYDGLQFSMNRIVNSLRVMYKDRAGDVINELQSMVDPKAAPMFDVMREELEAQQSPSGMRHTAKARAAAQDALIGALGQETEAKLIDQGVNLRTQDGKDSLLKMVEAVDRGIAPPHAVKALEGLIGKENLLNLRRTLRPQQASRDDLMEDDGETVGEGLEVDGDSGEVSVARQSNFDKRQAEKKVERTGASRMYGFKGTGTVRSSDGAKRDPFAPEGRITYQDTLKAEDEMIQRLAAGETYELPKGLRRPTLTKKGEKTFDGRDASEVARQRLSKMIGGESNERLVRNLLESGDPNEVKAGEMAQAALRELATARKAGDTDKATAIEKKLGQWRQRMFGDQSRGGEWDVQTRNVLEVLREEGADDLRILSLYRDYARMEMVAAKDPAERARLQNIIALLRPAIVDKADGKKGGAGAPRLSPAEHSNMMRLAERYFGDRTMAVAEQHSDRTPEKMSAGQVTAMASFGKAAMEFARKVENTQGKQAANEYVADRNLIQFAGNDGKPFHIPAGRLVLWGKKELGQYFEPAKADKYDNYTRNLEYLGALTLGINAVRESGMVALTKTGDGKYVPGGVSIADKFGRMQEFRADTKPAKGSTEFGDLFDGLPDNLMLATTNVFGFKKMMASRKIKPTSEAQDLLTKLREWRDEAFVPGDEGIEAIPESLKSRNAGTLLRNNVVDEERLNDKDAGGFDDMGRYQPGVTPSDRDGANPDRIQHAKANKETGFDAAAIPAGLGTERRIDAGKKAAARGQQLVDALDSNFDDGMKVLDSRMRMAKAPAFNANDPNTVRGGAHYALPVLEALTDENLSNMDIDAEQASKLVAIRKEAQKLVAESDLSNTVKSTYAPAGEVGASLGKPSGVGETTGRKFNRQMSEQDIIEQLETSGFEELMRAVSDGKPGAEKLAFAATGLTQDQATGEWRSGSIDLAAFRTAADKLDLPISKHWLGMLGMLPKLNAQSGQAKDEAVLDRAKAINEIRATLGNDITIRFEQTTGFSGAYLDQEAAIVISLTPAAGTLQTAYHEALHAFVARLVRGNDKAKQVLDALANHGPTMERVVALLDGYPEAIAQLKDGEERIAYVYQFWRAGLLDLPTPEATTMLQKLTKFFRAVLGRVSDLERGNDLLRAFARGSYAGDPSVAGKVMAKHLNEGAWGAKTLRKMDGLVQHVAALTMPAHSVLATSKSVTAQKLGNQLWTNPGEGEDGSKEEGYLNARERMAKRYSNEFSRIMAFGTERDHAAVIDYLQKETDPATIPYAPHREAVEKIRGLLQRFRKYMVEERGMNIGDRGPLYFPRVWSVANLQEKRDDFIEMMEKEYPMYNAEGVYNALIKRYSVEESAVGEGVVDDDAVLKPTQGAGNERILDVITGEHAAPFLEKSLVGTLTRYFHEGARAAEYTHRFGQKGEALAGTLGQINQELRIEASKMRKDGVLADQDAETKWVERQMRDIRRSVDAMEGTLGRDIGEGWRKASSWATVYQNVRLLPMALFSSIVDPLGMVARGATMKEAFDAFLQSTGEVFRNWKEMIVGKGDEARLPDEWERLAMAVGSVDAAVFNHHVSDEYASAFMTPGAKKVNDFFFKANGMEAWNKGMRVAATRSAVNFILRHRTGPETHSVRWLEEIGLTPGDIHVDPEGRLITDKHTLAAQLGITKEQAAGKVEKIHIAINRWVQGAVLTPNAAQRPAWSSDPHWSMFFHLKQFAYSFHQTILKRAVNELEYGNLGPIGAFIWYVPVMIASDLMRGLIQGGGELPSHMQGMDAGDHILRGLERSGVFGIGVVGVDAGQDIASLGGPAVEQIIDAMRDPLERTMIKAAPAHGLYAEALR